MLYMQKVKVAALLILIYLPAMVGVSGAPWFCELLGEKGGWGTRKNALQVPQCSSSTLLMLLGN